MKVTFIRHGRSTGNSCRDLSLLELTQKGWQQARAVAASWTEAPDTQAIVILASQCGRYGYHRITALLQRVGWQVARSGSGIVRG
jgi:broad specificity phosphatase PhoE